jgi:hypothetical protein
MRRSLRIHGNVDDSTNLVEIAPSYNLRRSSRMQRVLSDALLDLGALNVCVMQESDTIAARIVADVPTSLVLQNDDCRVFWQKLWSLFNSKRSLS